MPKKLQKESIYAEYDQDGDGIVTDEELGSIKQIKQTEARTRAVAPCRSRRSMGAPAASRAAQAAA